MCHETAAAADPSLVGWVSALATRHARALTHVARREGLTAEDALDAVQDAFHTFLTLPQARALSDAPDDAQALLTVLVRNTARNLRRRHHRAVPHEPVDGPLAESGELPAAQPSADALLEQAEQQVKLEGCVALLSEVQRHVVTLRMLEEMSGAQVARELGLTPGHVAVLLHRAKAELQRCVAS